MSSTTQPPPPYLSIYPASGFFNHLLCYTDFAKVEGLLLLWGGGVRRQLWKGKRASILLKAHSQMFIQFLQCAQHSNNCCWERNTQAKSAGNYWQPLFTLCQHWTKLFTYITSLHSLTHSEEGTVKTLLERGGAKAQREVEKRLSYTFVGANPGLSNPDEIP